MVRFILGVAIGALAMYWFLTGRVPWRREITSWFASVESSWSAEADGPATGGVVIRGTREIT